MTNKTRSEALWTYLLHNNEIMLMHLTLTISANGYMEV